MARRYRQGRRKSRRSFKRGLRTHSRNSLSTASFSKRGGNRI